jgi:hypothetical protein
VFFVTGASATDITVNENLAVFDGENAKLLCRTDDATCDKKWTRIDMINGSPWPTELYSPSGSTSDRRYSVSNDCSLHMSNVSGSLASAYVCQQTKPEQMKGSCFVCFRPTETDFRLALTCLMNSDNG